jgi:F-type H+-transporting ATPase subunit b
MQRGLRVVAAGGIAACVAAPARGAGGEGGSIGELFYVTLNFVILIAVLVYFARKPIREFFADRRERIRSDLKQAADLRAEAESHYAQWQRKLVDLETEIDAIRGTARERAEAERERILAEAEAAAARSRSDAHAAVEQELRRARAKLREEASDLAVAIAAEALRDRVTAADRDRLLDEFIETIERPTQRSGAGGEGKEH